MFKFITSKPLWVNILVAMLLAVALVWTLFSSLKYFTRHGQVLKVPSVAHLPYEQAKKQLEAAGFDVEIQDSVYMDTLAPLAVVKQFPEPDELVKVNRTVYLTVNRSVPPTIEMPNLVGMSFRNAELILKQFGLKLGDTLLKPDFAKNAILGQSWKGQDVKPSTKIPMGSVIDLVIGAGLAEVDIDVPDLFGFTYQEAKALIEQNGLSFSSVVADPDVRDTANAFIYRQSPDYQNEDKRVNRIRAGQMMDIWLSTQKPVRIDSTSLTPTPNFNP